MNIFDWDQYISFFRKNERQRRTEIFNEEYFLDKINKIKLRSCTSLKNISNFKEDLKRLLYLQPFDLVVMLLVCLIIFISYNYVYKFYFLFNLYITLFLFIVYCIIKFWLDLPKPIILKIFFYHDANILNLFTLEYAFSVKSKITMESSARKT